MIILGIDPGVASTGYGIIEKQGNKLNFIDCGLISTKKEAKLTERLFEIYKKLSSLIKKYSVDVMAVEKLFFNKNVKTAMSVGEARGVIFLAGSKNKIEIFIKDINKASEVSQSVMGFLGFPYWTLTYYEIHSSLFAWIELQREPIPLVLGIISLVAMLNIITTLIITIIEKTRTIGILRTLGISKMGIIKIFAYQGFQVGLYGVAAGCVLSFLFCFLQQQYKFIHLKGEIYFLDSLPILISPVHYAVVASITFVLVVLASILPAVIAAKIKPVSSLRFK